MTTLIVLVLLVATVTYAFFRIRGFVKRSYSNSEIAGGKFLGRKAEIIQFKKSSFKALAKRNLAKSF